PRPARDSDRERRESRRVARKAQQGSARPVRRSRADRGGRSLIRRAVALAFALLLAACAGAGPTEHEATASRSGDATRQILLTIRQPESLALGLTGVPNQRYAQRRYGPSPSVERILTQLAREHRLERVDGWPIASLSVYCEVFAVTDDRSLDAVIAELKADNRVELVQ